MTAATIAGHSNKSEYSKKNGYRKSSKTPWGNPIVYFFSLVLVAICITPVLYIIFGGFRTNSQITNHPSGMPNPWVPDNYKTVFESDIFWTELKNSTIVGIATMVGVVVLSIMVSFVIARYKFRYAPLMYALFSAGLMFPMTVGITPLYLLIRNLGLANSLWGLILPQIAFGLPQTIIILVPFLQSIPNELEEACLLVDAPALASSGAWSFRCPCLAWPPLESSPSWEAGMPTCCRCSCSVMPTSTHCHLAYRCSALNTPLTPHRCWPSPLWL